MGSKPSWLLVLLCVAGGLSLSPMLTSCVDSEVSGTTGDIQTTSDPDTTNDTVIPDTDTTIPDSVVVGTCGSDEDCERQLGDSLGACDLATCNIDTERCEVTKLSKCCETIADCPVVDDACTEFQCPEPGGSCVAVDLCPPCQLDRDCDAQAPACTRGRCSEGTCFFEPRDTCCVDAADCDDADICTNATCDAGVCAFGYNGTPGCCLTAPVINTSFDDGVAFEALSTADDAGWSTLETRFTPTPDFTLYLGNAARLQNTSAQGAYTAEARFRLGFTAPNSEIEIKFQSFIDLRRAPEVDRFRVVVRTMGGDERLVYTKTVAPTELWHWVKRTIRVEGGGETELVFLYDSGSPADADATTFGVMVDDLQVRTGCGDGAGCQGDVQCQVNDPCVVGQCGADGQCTFETLPGCCRENIDCEGDPNACGVGICVANQCRVDDVEGCCVNDAQCPESPDPCFLRSVCTDGRCDLLFVDVPCDDGNPCTADFCNDGVCERELLPGCCDGPDCPCDPSVAAFDFQDSPQGWSFDPAVQGFGWRRARIDQPGQPEVLYFGNPEGPSLDPGFPLTSVASSPPIDLPASAQAITVEFDVIVAFDGGTGRVVLEAQTQAGLTVQLWAVSPQTPRFEALTLSSGALGPLAGQTVTLRFVYRDADNAVLDGFGFIADNVIVQADCQGGGECMVDSQCPSAGPCTVGICQAGFCGLTELRCEIDDPCLQGFCNPDSGQCEAITIGGPGCECSGDDECVDFDPCTREFCEGGQCRREFDPNQPGCAVCQTGQDCNDGNPCTRDSCDADGVCRNAFDPAIPGCGFCMSDAGCDDGSPCTQDTCGDDGICRTQPIPGCCDSNSDCVDNNPCTEAVCLVDVGICLNPTVPGCCTSAGDCQDFDDCTADRCTNGQCENPTIGGPGCRECNINAQCDDNDPCTRDRCRLNGTCRNVFAPNQPGCDACDGNDECDDGNACTVDICGPDGRCFFEPTADCCGSAADCADGNGCTEDLCIQPDGVCANQPIPGCCGVGSECDDGNVCTIDVCRDDGTCQNTVDPNCPVCTPTSCNDGNNCTIDSCTADGVCNNEPLPLCCDDLTACDDGDVCTQDICGPLGVGCVNQPIAGCCTAATDCDDNNTCTRDRCFGNACENVPLDIPECVGCEAGSCDDGNVCTQDICNAFTGQCQNVPIDECCTGAFQCGDGDPCTFDQCQNNQCLHIPLTAVPGCAPDCEDDADCEDNNPCTNTACGNDGVCEVDVVFGCCGTNADCVVDDPCTEPLCLTGPGVCVNPPRSCNDFDNCTVDACDAAAGGCVNTPDPSCCSDSSQCDDNNPCTIDGCVGGACVRVVDDTCCTGDDECSVEGCGPGRCTGGTCEFEACCEPGPTGQVCDDGNVCTQDVCAADGQCNNTPEPGCCQRDEDCPAAADVCTVSRCDTAQLVCVTEPNPDCCTETTPVNATFEDQQLPGWVITTAGDGTTWSVSDARSAGGRYALYGGQPGAAEYGNNVDVVATTPAFQIPDTIGAELRFDTFIALENGRFDDFTFSIVLADTGEVVELLASDDVGANDRRRWISQRFNMSAYAGRRLQLRFRLESDFSIVDEGIYVDNIVVNGLCEPVTVCNGDGECNDGDVCTANRCVGGTCEAAPIAGCCESDSACDDGYACTNDACVQGDCQNVLIADCCVFDSECDDGRACTEDRCDTARNACVNVDVDGDCCTSDAQCDDGDACTEDRCRPNGTCGNRPDTENPSCCEAGTYFEERFNAFALPTFSVVTDGSDVHWQVHNGQVLSAPFALYYGNPATGNYDNGGRTFGSATSIAIQVPNTARNPRLSFGYWEDLDGFFFDDFTEVKVLIGGQATSVWDRTQIDFDDSQTWVPVDVPLPAAAIGRTIRLIIEFDSNDDFGNQGEGAYFDNIKVSSECAP